MAYGGGSARDWQNSEQTGGASEYEKQSWRDSYNGGKAAGDWTGNTNARLDREREAFQGATWSGSSTQYSAIEWAQRGGYAAAVMNPGGVTSPAPSTSPTVVNVGGALAPVTPTPNPTNPAQPTQAPPAPTRLGVGSAIQPGMGWFTGTGASGPVGSLNQFGVPSRPLSPLVKTTKEMEGVRSYPLFGGLTWEFPNTTTQGQKWEDELGDVWSLPFIGTTFTSSVGHNMSRLGSHIDRNSTFTNSDGSRTNFPKDAVHDWAKDTLDAFGSSLGAAHGVGSYGYGRRY